MKLLKERKDERDELQTSSSLSLSLPPFIRQADGQEKERGRKAGVEGRREERERRRGKRHERGEEGQAWTDGRNLPVAAG